MPEPTPSPATLYGFRRRTLLLVGTGALLVLCAGLVFAATFLPSLPILNPPLATSYAIKPTDTPTLAATPEPTRGPENTNPPVSATPRPATRVRTPGTSTPAINPLASNTPRSTRVRTRTPALTPRTPIPTAFLINTGLVSYKIPLTLRVNQDSPVELHIQPYRPVVNLTPYPVTTPVFHITPPSGVKEQVITADIDVYPYMSAALTTSRPDLLIIHANNSLRQHVDLDRDGAWSWTLNAKHPDNYQMTLTISGYLTGDDQIPAGPEFIDSRPLTASDPDSVGGTNGWLGIGGPVALVLIAGVAALGFYYYRSRRKSGAPAPAPATETAHGGADISDSTVSVAHDFVAGDVIQNITYGPNSSPDIATEQQLQAYIDHITDLQLNENLLTSPPGSQVRTVAQARTLSALRSFDAKRKSDALRFLAESELITGAEPIISLAGADLANANLSRLALSPNALRNVQSLQGTTMPDGRVWQGSPNGPFAVSDLAPYFPA